MNRKKLREETDYVTKEMIKWLEENLPNNPKTEYYINHLNVLCKNVIDGLDDSWRWERAYRDIAKVLDKEKGYEL
jgi:hypothetical protein